MNRLLSLMLLGNLAGCGDGGATAQQDATTPAVPQAPGTRAEVAVIAPSSAHLELEMPGEIEGAQDVVLAAAAGGFIEQVSVTEGQEVHRGDVLVRVDTNTYAAQLKQAKAQKALAQATLERTEALGALASAAQLDASRTSAEVADAAATLAGIRLSRSILKAPFDGVVAQVRAREGEIAGPGAPLVRVVQLDPVHVNVSVSDRDMGALRPGMPASVSTEAIPEVFTGELIHIDPAADLQTRSFTAKVEVANADRRLLPGMIANVIITSELAQGAVVVPQDWLVTRIDEVGVFLDEDLSAHWRPITPGAVVHDQVVIESGLREGDRVVITGQRDLAEGDRLIVTRQGTCCTDGRVTF